MSLGHRQKEAIGEGKCSALSAEVVTVCECYIYVSGSISVSTRACQGMFLNARKRGSTPRQRDHHFHHGFCLNGMYIVSERHTDFIN